MKIDRSSVSMHSKCAYVCPRLYGPANVTTGPRDHGREQLKNSRRYAKTPSSFYGRLFPGEYSGQWIQQIATDRMMKRRFGGGTVTRPGSGPGPESGSVSATRGIVEESLVYVGIFIVSVALYWNSMDGHLVHDDISAVATNQDVTNLTSYADLLRNDFWGTPLFDPSSHKSFRPLTVLSFRWNFLLHELRPRGFHAVNIILHGLVSGLFAWMCRHLLGTSLLTATWTATLFAFHPIHTEAVAGIVGRADLLATLFFLLTFFFYDKIVSSDSQRSTSHRSASVSWGAIIGCTLAAVTSKENGLTALPTAILWDILKSRKLWISGSLESQDDALQRRRFYRRTVLSSVIALLVLLWRSAILYGSFPAFSEQDNPAAFSSEIKTRVLTLLYLPVFNMGLLLAPISLSYDWQNDSIALVTTWADPRNVITLVFYASLATALLCSWIFHQRLLQWSLLVMILPMLPASNLIFPVGFVVAERLLYLPSLGFCVLVGRGTEVLLRSCALSICAGADQRKKQTKNSSSSSWRCSITPVQFLLLLSVITVTVCFGLKTWSRNTDWASRQTLFTSGLRTLPNNAKMHYNFANLQKDEGNFRLAIHHYRQAIRLWPSYASAHNNLGTVLLSQLGNQMIEDEIQVSLAERHFQQAITAHPRHANAHYNLAVVNIHRKNVSFAVHLLRRCLHIKPDHQKARNLIGHLASSLSRTSDLTSPLHKNFSEWLNDVKPDWNEDIPGSRTHLESEVYSDVF